MGRNVVDLTGRKFGRALVIGLAPTTDNANRHRARWHCRCDCGRKFIALGSSLSYGSTKSCGCLRRDQSSLNARKGLAKGRESQAAARRRHEEEYASRAAFAPAPVWRNAEAAADDLARALGMLLGAPA
jgi:hypothetical protein